MCVFARVRLPLAATLVVTLCAAPALAASSAAAPSTNTHTNTSAPGSSASGSNAPTASKPLTERELLESHELWATIDVCSPHNQLHTVGVRGSMPGNGVGHDKMFMSFRLQYLSTTSKHWVDLVSGATPTFVPVGGGGAARQDGQSFQLVPGKAPATLRGVVDFQWRRGGTVLASAARPTTAGRKSLAGADPKGFSAATCVIS
jgi:hypothetical protein